MPRSKWKKEPQAYTRTRANTYTRICENGIIYNNISENYGSEKKITATDDNREKVKIKNKTTRWMKKRGKEVSERERERAAKNE